MRFCYAFMLNIEVKTFREFNHAVSTIKRPRVMEKFVMRFYYAFMLNIEVKTFRECI